MAAQYWLPPKKEQGLPESPLLLQITSNPTASSVVVDKVSSKSTNTMLDNEALSSGVSGKKGRVESMSKTNSGNRMCKMSS